MHSPRKRKPVSRSPTCWKTRKSVVLVLAARRRVALPAAVPIRRLATSRELGGARRARRARLRPRARAALVARVVLGAGVVLGARVVLGEQVVDRQREAQHRCDARELPYVTAGTQRGGKVGRGRG